MLKSSLFSINTHANLMIFHRAGVIQNLAARLAALCHFVALQQGIRLTLADYTHLHLWRGHVYVQFAADKQTHRARETSVGLHDLRRLLFDDECTCNQRTQ